MTTWDELASQMLAEKGPAALTCRQWLMPAEGHDAVIFPPTFAAAEGGKADYNIDPGDEKTPSIAIMDTVGSQANRMEPLFKRSNGEDTDYSRLVPQIEIKAGNKIVHLLDAGHRAADAIVRYSMLGPKLKEAFETYRESGDATELAKIAPTSLIFGLWDSREKNGVKLPRLVASTIRAYDVIKLRRSAQYNPPISYVDENLFDDDFLEAKYKDTNVGSFFGLKAAPASLTHGGVIVRGELRREAILSLIGLRAIGPRGAGGDLLRRYILGLALVAMTYNRDHNLRQGCLLVYDPEKAAKWELVFHTGKREPFAAATADEVLKFAREQANGFGVGKDGSFDFLSREQARANIDKVINEKPAKNKGKK